MVRNSSSVTKRGIPQSAIERRDTGRFPDQVCGVIIRGDLRRPDILASTQPLFKIADLVPSCAHAMQSSKFRFSVDGHSFRLCHVEQERCATEGVASS